MNPTPYPEVNTTLHTLQAEVQTILGDRLVGIYLYGSLASGDFDPQRSDIDFLVITTGELPQEIIAALEAMHMRLVASNLKWAKKLEGAYLPQNTLRRYDPDAAPCPGVNECRFLIASPGSDWIIQRHILRQHGVVVTGPARLSEWIDPVQPDDLRYAVRSVLDEWWTPMLAETNEPTAPSFLQRSEYQAYAVLTMCRALHTFEHGCIASKPAAARWAMKTLEERWARLIAWALDWQPDSPANIQEANHHLTDTLDFIRYTLAQKK